MESQACEDTWTSITLQKIKQDMRSFANERDWNQYHTVRNLLLALTGEVGELAEIFQWRGEVKEGLVDFSDEDKEHVGEELSDILLYLIRLADKCGVDLGKAVQDKMEKNAKKYPVDKCKGSSKKYHAYTDTTD